MAPALVTFSVRTAALAYPGNIRHTQFMDQDGESSFTAPQVHTVSLPQLHGLSPGNPVMVFQRVGSGSIPILVHLLASWPEG